MSWVKVDDGYPDHPKLQGLKDLAPVAGWLHISAICYCSRHLTDGYVPEGVVPRLATFPGRIKALDLARLLVQVGLWEAAVDGFTVHDYLAYNPSRTEVEKKRAAWAERQQRSRVESRVESRRDSPVSHRTTATRDSTSPVPVPLSRSAPNGAHIARDGLPNLTPDAVELLESVTGMTAYQAGDKQLEEYDRLVGSHGLPAVRRTFDVIRNNTTMTARQLVWATVKYLEPIPDAKATAKAEREVAESAASAKRRLNTLRVNHGNGWHDDDRDPRCPACMEVTA